MWKASKRAKEVRARCERGAKEADNQRNGGTEWQAIVAYVAWEELEMPDMKRQFRHLNVPYRSQWGDPALNREIRNGCMDPCDDPAWRNTGFRDETAYRFWSRRVCGIACLESILDFLGIAHENRKRMLGEAIDHGVYEIDGEDSVKGLIYRPFCRWIRSRYQLNARIYEGAPLASVTQEISPTCMIMASVSPEIATPQQPNHRRGGHLVLIHGADAGHIWFHNPSGIPPFQCDANLAIDHAERFHAGRGMLIDFGEGANVPPRPNQTLTGLA